LCSRFHPLPLEANGSSWLLILHAWQLHPIDHLAQDKFNGSWEKFLPNHSGNRTTQATSSVFAQQPVDQTNKTG
jgi:hypothetical protein